MSDGGGPRRRFGTPDGKILLSDINWMLVANDEGAREREREKASHTAVGYLFFCMHNDVADVLESVWISSMH